MNRRAPASTLLALALVLTLAACSSPMKKYHQDFYLFGTVMGVTLWADSEARAQQAFTSLHARFQTMHEDWHAWNPGALTAINRAFAEGRAVQASPGIVEMVRRSQALEESSEGRFNPAIGGLIALWGFHTSDYPILGPPPDRAAIEALLKQRPSSRDIEIDGERLVSKNPAVQLDFGGIAKGHAIDIACAMLREQGIENAVINAGGDLRAIGRHGERPWRIAVRAPVGGIIGSLETGPDEAVFTSGNYERFRQQDTERYPHILDPRSGWPVQDLASVTVIASEGLLADAAATAITVAGMDEWTVVAKALGLEQVLVVDGDGRVYMTPAISSRIDLEEDTEAVIVPF
ncbi:MAG: FAD:protein FMN transferase [Xanthomonadales bacterium]|nr:FAD:protein FMN transferase [Gammaproteobacteria bacterium]MBT8051176.1 FAD:protein FMN transferase [Gammaproteobacteria bacterium]MBT8055971.1 FAD:protein FMN transferase [Gammaproteobacteria bacterium]NNJ78238.1 FAD:protein FMN transferase [Xanthomonadales bacterium]NNL05219.1 FAD:protein FMN transferase [Xanthomonadales bacterium]